MLGEQISLGLPEILLKVSFSEKPCYSIPVLVYLQSSFDVTDKQCCDWFWADPCPFSHGEHFEQCGYRVEEVASAVSAGRRGGQLERGGQWNEQARGAGRPACISAPLGWG